MIKTKQQVATELDRILDNESILYPSEFSHTRYSIPVSVNNRMYNVLT